MISAVMRGLVSLVLVLGACSRATDPPVPPDASAPAVMVAIEPTAELDLLFMLDNSPSPTGQMELGRAVPALLDELAGLPGGGIDLHIGVVTSDLGAGRLPLPNGGCMPLGGDRGVLRTGNCPMPDGRRWVSAARGQLSAVTAQLACFLNVGATGCGYEHQLAAVVTALDPATTENAGFVRPGAHLAVVMITDEDDCSGPPDTDFFAQVMPGQTGSFRCALAGHVCGGTHPPAAVFSAPLASCRAADDGPLLPVPALAERLRAVKADPARQLTVAAVYGVPAAHPGLEYRIISTTQGVDYNASCSTSLGESVMGLRMARFMEAFGIGGRSFDVCVEDMAPIAREIGRTIARRLTSACLPARVTDCQVSGGSSLPHCGSGAGPCWYLRDEPGCGSAGQQLVVENAGTLPAGARITAQCAP